MSKEITLPSGNTVKLREPETLLKKDRDKVTEIASQGDNEILQATAMQDGLIAVSVLEWSFDLIPPSVRITSLGELSPKDYDALALECEPALACLFPSLVQTKETETDPKADTANSND
jgi:hypothetical protein